MPKFQVVVERIVYSQVSILQSATVEIVAKSPDIAISRVQRELSAMANGYDPKIPMDFETTKERPLEDEVVSTRILLIEPVPGPDKPKKR